MRQLILPIQKSIFLKPNINTNTVSSSCSLFESLKMFSLVKKNTWVLLDNENSNPIQIQNIFSASVLVKNSETESN